VITEARWWVTGAVRLGRGPTALFFLPPIELPSVDNLVLIAKRLVSPRNCLVDGERDVRCCHQDRCGVDPRVTFTRSLKLLALIPLTMSTRSFKLLRICCQIHGKARSKCGCLVLVLTQRLCTVQYYGRLRRKVVVAVAGDHDVTAANGTGAIGRDAGSEGC